MSVAKAEFRVLQPITKAGRTREPGFTFIAGVDGEHVKRWIALGKVSIVRRVETKPARRVTPRKSVDKIARSVALLVLAVTLVVAARLRPRSAEPTVSIQIAPGSQLAQEVAK